MLHVPCLDNGVLNDRFYSDKLNHFVPVSQHTHLTVISTVSTHANIIPSNDSKDCFKNLLRFTQADKYFTHLNLNKSCDVRLTNKCGAQKINKNELRKLWFRGCLFLLYVIFSYRVDYNKQKWALYSLCIYPMFCNSSISWSFWSGDILAKTVPFTTTWNQNDEISSMHLQLS